MKKIYAKSYGILPDTGKDYTQEISRMLLENKSDSVFILEKGRYDFWSDNANKRPFAYSNTDFSDSVNIAVLFEDMENVAFDGSGADLRFHGQMTTLAAYGCKDILFKNFNVDWDIPLCSEGKVLAVGDGYADISINPSKYPFSVRDSKLYFKGENWEAPFRGMIEFDSNSAKVRAGTGDCFPRMTFTLLTDDVVRFHGSFKVYPTVGDWLVLRHSPRVHAGIFAENTKNFSMKNVKLHNAGGLGILCQFCENLSFNAVEFSPNRAIGRRYLCGNEDGMHLTNNRGHIQIEDCSYFGLMDDPINVHGASVQITNIKSKNTILGRFGHHQATCFSNWALKGDEVSFLNCRTLAECGRADVKQFTLLTPDTFEIEFESDIPDCISEGDALENITNTVSLTIRGCHFGSCRARGVLITTMKPVLVENNLFESSGAAILLAGDANQWFESGACHDVTIRNNIFEDCCLSSDYQFCSGVISIEPEIPEPEKNLSFHRNIRIYDNCFKLGKATMVFARSTTGLTVKNNRIFYSAISRQPYPPKGLFVLEYCKDTVIQNNIAVGTLSVSGAAMEKCENTFIE